MSRLDSTQSYAQLIDPPPTQVVEADLPPFRYLMIDGAGGPLAPRYQDAITTLYAVAHALQRALQPGIDFAIGPIETLWWADAPGGLHLTDPADWRWTAMIVVPDGVGEAHLAAAIDGLRRETPKVLLLDPVRIETFDEGACVQIMHVGPYAADTEASRRLRDYMTDNGIAARGHHHEIYLTDPRTTAPELMRTVIRQPVHLPEP
ncbi:MAG TPA: hypothetical protein DCY40_00945 [Actinobacteria bacterium]|nr:hypothetical protein [Actinomycetota bacterium]